MAHQIQTSLAELLLCSLEELSDEELKEFKYTLSHLVHKKYQPLPKGQLEDLDITDLADMMISSYSEDGAFDVMVEILKKMGLNDIAAQLNEHLQKDKTSIPDLLLEYLKALNKKELKEFKYNLSHLVYKKYQPIPKGQVEDLDITDLADMMISSYSEDGALDVMVEILKKMGLNDFAAELNEHLQKGKTWLPNLLLYYLKELSNDDLKKIKYNLIHLVYKKYQPIPKGQVKDLDTTDLTDMMISSYSEDGALDVMVQMLKKINLNDLAYELDEDLQKGSKAGIEWGYIPKRTHPPVVPNQSAVAFVDQHRPAIVQRVSLIDPILDDLHGHIGGEKYSNIRAASTSQDKMRKLYEMLNTDRLKELFYDALKKNESHLVTELLGL